MQVLAGSVEPVLGSGRQEVLDWSTETLRTLVSCASDSEPSTFYSNHRHINKVSNTSNSTVKYVMPDSMIESCYVVDFSSKSSALSVSGHLPQWQIAKRRRLKSPLHSSLRASFRDTSYFSRYRSLMVSKSNCRQHIWSKRLKQNSACFDSHWYIFSSSSLAVKMLNDLSSLKLLSAPVDVTFF